eukprot:scaffold4420_cov187-Amphora_coffeaeformis.AAC.27
MRLSNSNYGHWVGKLQSLKYGCAESIHAWSDVERDVGSLVVSLLCGYWIVVSGPHLEDSSTGKQKNNHIANRSITHSIGSTMDA